jgi:hypothetical protein
MVVAHAISGCDTVERYLGIGEATVIKKLKAGIGPPSLDLTEFGWVRNEKIKTLVPVGVPSNVLAAPAKILELTKCSCQSAMFSE